MARVPYENKLKVYWATAIANTAAPTVAEITSAGKYLGSFLAPDATNFGMSQARVDTRNIDGAWNTEVMGRLTMQPMLTLYRDDAVETNGYTLIVGGSAGFLIFSNFGVPVATDKVMVVPCQMGEPIWLDSGNDTAQKFEAHFALTGDVVRDATVAA